MPRCHLHGLLVLLTKKSLRVTRNPNLYPEPAPTCHIFSFIFQNFHVFIYTTAIITNTLNPSICFAGAGLLAALLPHPSKTPTGYGHPHTPAFCPPPPPPPGAAALSTFTHTSCPLETTSLALLMGRLLKLLTWTRPSTLLRNPCGRTLVASLSEFGLQVDYVHQAFDLIVKPLRCNISGGWGCKGFVAGAWTVRQCVFLRGYSVIRMFSDPFPF